MDCHGSVFAGSFGVVLKSNFALTIHGVVPLVVPLDSLPYDFRFPGAVTSHDIHPTHIARHTSHTHGWAPQIFVVRWTRRRAARSGTGGARWLREARRICDEYHHIFLQKHGVAGTFEANLYEWLQLACVTIDTCLCPQIVTILEGA